MDSPKDTPLPSNEAPKPPASRPGGIWIVVAIGVLGAIIYFLQRPKPVVNAVESRVPTPTVERRSDPSDSVIANGVYLRLIEDESSSDSQQRLERAISRVSRSRKLSVNEVRTALDRYLADLETDPGKNPDEAALAAILRGKPEVAAKTVPLPTSIATPLEQEKLPSDWLIPQIDRIQSAVTSSRFDEAETIYGDARRLIDKERDAERWTRIEMAGFFLRFEQGRTTEALDLAREVLDTREKILPPESAGIANALHNTAVCLMRLERHDEAALLLERACKVYGTAYGEGDIAVADSASELAHALSETGRLEESEAAARRAITLYEAGGEMFELRHGLALDRLGCTLLLAKRPADAEPVLRRSIELYERHSDVRAKDHADAVHRLGLALARQDRRADALPYLQRSTEIAKKWFANDDPLYAVYFHNLGVWADAAGDDPGTVAAYEHALAILSRYRQRTGREPAQLAQTAEFYQAYLRRSGTSEAEIDRRVRGATNP